MKGAAKKRSTANSFGPDEYVRVVPLHQPTPAVSGLSRGRRAQGSGADPFAVQLHAIQAKLTYRGGPLLQNVRVYSIFWGKLWGTTTNSQQVITNLNRFFGAILVSPAIDQLAEYNVGTKKIGHGSFLGSKTISTNAPSGSVTDSAIRAQLKRWIAAKTIPAVTSNTLYFIYLDPGVTSIMGGSKSCQSYCGYHNNTRKTYYAVMPYPSCSGCLGGKQTFDALTGTSSHELCEAITDPVPGRGWYDDQNGEIGDICAWNFKQVAGYNVQLEWSNKQNKCV